MNRKELERTGKNWKESERTGKDGKELGRTGKNWKELERAEILGWLVVWNILYFPSYMG